MKQGNVTFRVKFKQPLHVKTLSEYKESKNVSLKKKIMLKDTEQEVLFLHQEQFKK